MQRGSGRRGHSWLSGPYLSSPSSDSLECLEHPEQLHNRQQGGGADAKAEVRLSSSSTVVCAVVVGSGAVLMVGSGSDQRCDVQESESGDDVAEAIAQQLSEQHH